MTDPAAMEGMMGMMKGNMAMMIPQTLIMGWINAFFAGFVISMFFNGSEAMVGSGWREEGRREQKARKYGING